MKEHERRSFGVLFLPLAWLAAMGGEIRSHTGYGSESEPDGLPLSKAELKEVEEAKAEAAKRKVAAESETAAAVEATDGGGYL